jgi:carboxylesterase
MSEVTAFAEGLLPALLLVHGFNGEPVDMDELGDFAQRQGFAAKNLLLPGHGSTARALAQATWADWSRAVRDATAALIDTGRPVILVGHSMGGALALHEAAANAGVAGVVALCPPLYMYPGQVQLASVWRHVIPYLPTLREDIYDREARLRYTRRAYRWTPLAAAHSLFSALPGLRAQLGHITCPVMVIVARRDHVVPMRDGIQAYHLLKTSHKELMVLERSYHVVTKDVERLEVFERVCRFATRVMLADPAPGRLEHAVR